MSMVSYISLTTDINLNTDVMQNKEIYLLIILLNMRMSLVWA